MAHQHREGNGAWLMFIGRSRLFGAAVSATIVLAAVPTGSSVLAASSPSVSATVSGFSNPYGIAVTPNGSYAYVADYAAQAVYVVDTATNAVSASLSVSTPFDVAITPNGSYGYAPNYVAAPGTVTVIDTSTNSVTATVSDASLNYPRGVAISPNGSYAYVANYGGGTVSVIDTSTNSVTAAVTVGTSPMGVAISPNGSYAYVANVNDGTVSVIDTSTNSVTATVTVGSGPRGVAVSPDGSTAYVPNSSSGTVSVIDTSTNSVTATVTVGSYPADVAFTPNSATAYVSNYFSGSVSVIATGLGASSGGGSGSAGAVPQVVSVDLDLEAAELPASRPQSATIGSWYQLPASADVVGVGENAGKTFLGVATREDFPVAIAQRQVDNGWGVYEIYDADGRLESVFIPAGKHLHLTAAPRLHAIWSQ